VCHLSIRRKRISEGYSGRPEKDRPTYPTDTANTRQRDSEEPVVSEMSEISTVRRQSRAGVMQRCHSVSRGGIAEYGTIHTHTEVVRRHHRTVAPPQRLNTSNKYNPNVRSPRPKGALGVSGSRGRVDSVENNHSPLS